MLACLKRCVFSCISNCHLPYISPSCALHSVDRFVGEKIEKGFEKSGAEIGEDYGGYGGMALGEAVAAVVCPECAVTYAVYGLVAGEAVGGFIGWHAGKMAAEYLNDKLKEVLHKGVSKVIDFVGWVGRKIARRVSNAIPEVGASDQSFHFKKSCLVY